MVAEGWTERRLSNLEQTNWWVITGGPSSGKTSLLECLSKRGYRVMTEAARDYIDQQMLQGKTLAEIRSDELAFQDQVLDMKVEREEQVPVSDLVFWDRGLHGDSAAYLAVTVQDRPKNNDPHKDIFGTDKIVVIRRRYKGVFLLEPLQRYTTDYARIEDERQAARIHRMLEFAYEVFGYKPIHVPAISPVEARAQWVLDNILSVA